MHGRKKRRRIRVRPIYNEVSHEYSAISHKVET